jgi:predicted adenine nucleotide alpha hydrolase (AANH) superfamily ATPase
MKKLLLHICCAPCSASIIKLCKDDFDISFYWHNPNIWDADEYDKRKTSAIRYAAFLEFDFLQEKDFVYDYDAWKNQSQEICANCYEIRLLKTAAFAKKLGFKYFSTSLLSSPYQKHELIKQIASNIADKIGVEFLYRDSRGLFYEGKNELRQRNYYTQKYCACEKSVGT